MNLRLHSSRSVLARRLAQADLQKQRLVQHPSVLQPGDTTGILPQINTRNNKSGLLLKTCSGALRLRLHRFNAAFRLQVRATLQLRPNISCTWSAPPFPAPTRQHGCCSPSGPCKACPKPHFPTPKRTPPTFANRTACLHAQAARRKDQLRCCPCTLTPHFNEHVPRSR